MAAYIVALIPSVMADRALDRHLDSLLVNESTVARGMPFPHS
jgi:hypothetical protein